MTVSGDGDFTMANVLVSGDGDFTMANVLGFFNADLILLLKTEQCWQCRALQSRGAGKQKFSDSDDPLRRRLCSW